MFVKSINILIKWAMHNCTRYYRKAFHEIYQSQPYRENDVKLNKMTPWKMKHFFTQSKNTSQHLIVYHYLQKYYANNEIIWSYGDATLRFEIKSQ